MTTPITTGSFDGILVPAEVSQRILTLVIDQAPFAESLTPWPTTASAVAWPTAAPTGYAWLAELAPFPDIVLNDDSYVSGVCKIGGIVDLSNEAFSDASTNMTQALGLTLRDSLSRDLDQGLLVGAGAPAPVGITTVAATAVGADLHAQVVAARGAIGDSGGKATHLAASATVLATEDGKLATSGGLQYPGGFAQALGLIPVPVPGMAVPLVYDRSRCFLVQRDDSGVEASRDYHFHLDATSLRIKLRCSMAVPDPAKAVRKCATTVQQSGTRTGKDA